MSLTCSLPSPKNIFSLYKTFILNFFGSKGILRASVRNQHRIERGFLNFVDLALRQVTERSIARFFDSNN